MRPISGTSTLAILNSLFEQFGPDSTIGRMASIIQGSTDTTFYVLTLYFGSIGIKKIKYALKAGLFADFIGIVAAILITNFFF
jgi:spore maturation protein B